MKRKLLSLLTTVFAISTCVFTLIACNHEHSYTEQVTLPTCEDKGYTTYVCECGDKYIDNYVDKLGHDYLTIKSNELTHWVECECGDKASVEIHKPGAIATEYTDQVCTICNYVITPALGHIHTLHLIKIEAEQQSCTEEGNIEYYVCSCGSWFTDNTASTEIIDKSSVIIKKDEHKYTELKYNKTEHWDECVCGDKANVKEHILGAEATETTDQVCTVCNCVVTPALGHLHVLHLTKIEAKPQSCTTKGNIEYYVCSCDSWFTDNTATVEIIDQESVIIEKDEHKYIEIKANETAHWRQCVCGDKQGIEGHTGGTATCEDKAVCDICSTPYGEAKGHHYNILKSDDIKHWYECVCGNMSDIEFHNYETIKYDTLKHWLECSCGSKTAIEFHRGGVAACGKRAECSVCNQKYGAYKTHTYIEHVNNEGVKILICECGDTKEEVDENVLIVKNNVIIGVTDYGRTLHKIVIPNGVVGIEDFAFEGCSNLAIIEIPESVISVGDFAFNDCVNIVSVTITDKIKRIGSGIARNCKKIIEVYVKTNSSNLIIPNYKNYLGYTVENIYTNPNNSKLSNVDGCLIYTDGSEKILVGYIGNEKDLVLPNNITKIHEFAFYKCDGLTSVTIPNSVREISYGAFIGCKNLKTVNMGSNITKIGNSAFNGCINLETITYNGTISAWKPIKKGFAWILDYKITIKCDDGNI